MDEKGDRRRDDLECLTHLYGSRSRRQVPQVPLFGGRYTTRVLYADGGTAAVALVKLGRKSDAVYSVAARGAPVKFGAASVSEQVWVGLIPATETLIGQLV